MISFFSLEMGIMKNQEICTFLKNGFRVTGCHSPRLDVESEIIQCQKLEYRLRVAIETKEAERWFPDISKSKFQEMDSETRIEPYLCPLRFPTPLLDLYCQGKSSSEKSLAIEQLASEMSISKTLFDLPFTTSPMSQWEMLEVLRLRKGLSLPSPHVKCVFTEDQNSAVSNSFITTTSQWRLGEVLPIYVLPRLIPNRYWYLNIPPPEVLPYKLSTLRRHLSTPVLLTDDLALAIANDQNIHQIGADRFIISSWYGELEGLERLDTGVFDNRHIYFWLSPHAGYSLKKLYQIADKVRARLADSAEFSFVTNILDGQDADATEILTTPSYRVLSIEDFRQRFLKLESAMDLSRSAMPLNNYMRRGSRNVFYPTTPDSKAHIGVIYMTIALGCRHGVLPWDLGSSRTAAINIFKDSSANEKMNYFVYSQELEDVLRNYNATCPSESQFLVDVAAREIFQQHMQEQPQWDVTDDTADKIKAHLSVTRSRLPEKSELAPDDSIVILDFPALTRLRKTSPLNKMLDKLRQQGVIIWLIFREPLSKKQLVDLNPDAIWEISERLRPRTRVLFLDIRSTGPKQFQSAELHAKVGTGIYQRYHSKSRYATVARSIREWTLQGVSEIEIRKRLNQGLAGLLEKPISPSYLRQLKRQFNIHTHQRPAQRRFGIADKAKKMYAKGKTPEEIAKKLSTSTSYVKKCLGLPRGKVIKFQEMLL